MDLNLSEVRKIVRRALAEDIGAGDITTMLTVRADAACRAEIVAKEDGVIAGLPVAAVVLREVAAMYDAGEVSLISTKTDGDRVSKGETFAHVAGPTRVILTAERTLLNLMQRMSGIATRTARLVNLVKHTKAKVVDTRKTAPGLRILDKYAVSAGGGTNHRFGLYDAVLIKDNHIRAAGGVSQAINAVRAGAPEGMRIEIETENLDQVREALNAGAEMILLDNMTVSQLKKAVGMCRGRALTEASGNVDESNIAEIAKTGVDWISVGALTHSVQALDLSLEIME